MVSVRGEDDVMSEGVMTAVMSGTVRVGRSKPET